MQMGSSSGYFKVATVCWRVSFLFFFYLQHFPLQIYDVLGNYLDRFVCMQFRENSSATRRHLERFHQTLPSFERKICRSIGDVVHLACRLSQISPAIAAGERSHASCVCERHNFHCQAAEGFRAFSLFANDFIPAVLRYINQN